MADHSIYILDINPDGSLQLSDNGKTVAQPGDTVRWLVAKCSSVTIITSIHDTSETKVFKPKPFRRYDHHLEQWEWVGKVRINHEGKSATEHYSIYYTKKGGTAVYAYDPRIQVDSAPS